MQVAVNITLGPGEAANWTMTLDEVADAVLKALGGDETKDYVTAHVNNPSPGTAGTPPEGMGTPVP
jgi:hypothetical protein